MLYNSWLWCWETCNISPLSAKDTVAIYHAITAELMGGAQQKYCFKDVRGMKCLT